MTSAYEFSDALRGRIEANLTAFERRRSDPEGLRAAAVALVIAGDEEGDACFLITRRASTLRKHAGQWALPGGRIEDDEQAEDTALRELQEEVGLRLGRDALLGSLDDYPTRSGYVITPVVVWGLPTPTLAHDTAEVESTHFVPLGELDRPDSPRLLTGLDPERPIIQVPLFDHNVHAPTAATLYQFSEVGLHGRATRVAHFDQPPFAWR
jgi:8-oxo-dGTP pyrophosphatase MutT (NUDIX family)